MLNAKSIGSKIAAARKTNHLSQAELAQQVPISPQAVGKWERGESMPDIATLSRLAELLGVDLNYFSDNFQNAPVPGGFETPTEQVAKDRPVGLRTKFDWNWDMSQGNWSDADFSGLKNVKEKFSASNMKNCKLMHSDLSGLILAKNNIERCDFSGSDLRDSKIQHCNLLDNQLLQCCLIDAAFFKSNIEKCDFSGADFSGTEILESNLEKNIVNEVVWKFTKFNRTNISQTVFRGTFENCHFENSSFYNVTFESATLLNCFFKYNDRFRKVRFADCQVDSITYAFLKNNQANLEGIRLM